MRLRVLLTALVVLLFPARVVAAETDIGVQAAVLSGEHLSTGSEDVHGVIPGALAEFDERFAPFQLHLEGVPPITASAANSSVSLSIFNAELTGDVLAHGVLRVGIGGQIVNLTNVDYRTGIRQASRATGFSYVAAGHAPLFGNERGISYRVSVIPNVRANLLSFDTRGVALPVTPEVGAEVDYAASYYWQRGNWRYETGVRGLNYTTKQPQYGYLVDRNTGAGVTFQLQYRFGRS